ncbi:MAG TPA: hypothetical protein PKB07_17880, partial [Flavilitoribacter sp.]|nr:hypothetical protein [Flavilitoribacter sp.]
MVRKWNFGLWLFMLVGFCLCWFRLPDRDAPFMRLFKIVFLRKDAKIWLTQNSERALCTTLRVLKTLLTLKPSLSIRLRTGLPRLNNLPPLSVLSALSGQT